MSNEKVLPTWEKDLFFLFNTERVINFEGHVNDKYLSYDRTGYSTLTELLVDMLKAKGYSDVSIFNPVSGFSADPSEQSAGAATRSHDPRGRDRSIMILANKLAKELNEGGTKKAFIVEDASYLCVSNMRQSNEEHDSWAKIRTGIKTSSEANKVFFIFESAADIPRALDGCSGLSKRIIVSKPDNTQRKQFIALVFPYLSEEDVESISDIAADIPLRKLQDIFRAVCAETLNPCKTEIVSYIKQYIYGYSDSPWEALSKAKVASLEDELNKQIKGQSNATKTVADKVRLAWSGIGSALDGEKAPKGIAMLCGPTGVGKTELAKQLTRLVMGDPNLLIRIDASEYEQEHAAQKLVGSPPGYVGYEQGGQLTNLVNERPFSVILIDEIEKAHPRFWDYFLQVLQDGRLTDGRGNLCVFNNTFLIFTTNLGAKEAAENADKRNTDKIIYDAIEQYFCDINRREIFGRLKKHIVPFNYITDDVAREIVEKQLKNFCDNYFETKHVQVNFSDAAVQTINAVAGHASEYGGRDIKNTVNECVENPFLKIFEENEIMYGTVIHVADAKETGDANDPIELVYSVDNTNAMRHPSGNSATGKRRQAMPFPGGGETYVIPIPVQRRRR